MYQGSFNNIDQVLIRRNTSPGQSLISLVGPQSPIREFGPTQRRKKMSLYVTVSTSYSNRSAICHFGRIKLRVRRQYLEFVVMVPLFYGKKISFVKSPQKQGAPGSF